MNADSSALLRALGSGVLPPSVSPAAPVQPTGTVQFQQLLEQAANGGVSSGVPVSVARTAGVDLSPSQLTRLAGAGDRAEAAGASRALVMIDGQVLTMDVPQRTITGKADLSSTRVLNGVDAVITVAADTSAPGLTHAPLPSSSILNKSLLSILGGKDAPATGSN